MTNRFGNILSYGKLTMNVRLIDVAEDAGVSITTASHALAGKGRVSEESRNRVLRSAEKLNYQPNIHAISLSSTRITHVAVIVLEDYEKAFEWYFIRRIIIGIESVLSNNALYPIIIPVSLQDDPQKTVAKIISSGSGMVASIHFGSQEVFRMLTDRGLPVIAVNNSGFSDGYPTISSDDFRGAFNGTMHMFKRGCKTVGFVDYEKTDIPTVLNDRFTGYRQAVEANGNSVRETLVHRVELNNHEEIRKTMGELFTHHPNLDGLFIHDDYLAAQIIQALYDLGKRIPDDVSVLAPGDMLDYSLPFVPQITTMQIDTDQIGRMVAHAILAQMNDDASFPLAFRIPQSLVERKTCRKEDHCKDNKGGDDERSRN